jgi:hypothetical protein
MKIGPKTTNRRAGRRIAILGAALAVATGIVAYALWWRKNPSTCPYALRYSVELPYPFITRARLREILAPRPGEKVLEVGPGTGYYALHTARWLAEGTPQGTLDVLDLQQALRELRRVLKSGGRLVVGEVFPDFHIVPFGALKERAEASGLAFERRLGGPLGYFASFRVPRDGAYAATENIRGVR